MSFVFRGSRGDIESGIPELSQVRIHAPRPVNANSVAFLVTAVLLLFMILNSYQASPYFLGWLVVEVFLMATSLRMYTSCRQLEAQARSHAAAANDWLGHAELRLQMTPSIAFGTRGLMLQLALLDREFDELDYDTLRELDSDNPSASISMSEDEINALPIHEYTVPGSGNSRESEQLGSSVSAPDVVDSRNAEEGSKTSEDELTCTICLEHVKNGDLLRSFPCLHQFHTNCIDRWLRQQGTCPVCKLKISSGWRESKGSESDMSDMV